MARPAPEPKNPLTRKIRPVKPKAMNDSTEKSAVGKATPMMGKGVPMPPKKKAAPVKPTAPTKTGTKGGGMPKRTTPMPKAKKK